MIRKTAVSFASLFLLAAIVISSLSSSRAQQPAEVADPIEEPSLAAATLAASLTSEQQQQIGSILESYADEIEEIVSQLPPLPGMAAGGEHSLFLPSVVAPVSQVASAGGDEDAADANAELFKQTQAVAEQLKVVQDAINSEVATLLTAEQQALHTAALAPVNNPSTVSFASDECLSCEVADDATTSDASLQKKHDKDKLRVSVIHQSRSDYDVKMAYGFAYYYVLMTSDQTEQQVAQEILNDVTEGNEAVESGQCLSGTAYFAIEVADYDFRGTSNHAKKKLEKAIEKLYKAYEKAYKKYQENQSEYALVISYYTYYAVEMSVDAHEYAVDGYGDWDDDDDDD